VNATSPGSDLPDDLEALRAELAWMRQFRGEIVKLASHDLRSPLALIIGYSDLIRLDLPTDSPLQDYMDTIMNAANRMTGLIDAIALLEQLRTVPLALEDHVDVGAVVRAVVDDLRGVLADRRQTVALDLDPSAPALALDRRLIADAISQIVINASQFSENGRSVRVRLETEADRLVFMVEDEGCGIPEELQPRAFDAFIRGKLPSGARSEGRGIGLWIVRTIVERHGGGVLLHSTPDVGSQIGFWLPIA
jgi:signal transduction histidine kinase